MSEYEVCRPDGIVLPIDQRVYEHAVSVGPPIGPLDDPKASLPVTSSCLVRLGTVCPHGYRVDPRGAPRQGRGCRVVAVDHSRELLSLDTDRLSDELVQVLRALPIDASTGFMGNGRVEVLLDDGRVVETTVRRPASDLHGTWVAWLEGFTGCFLLARCRPVGWAYWSRRLDGP